MGSIQRRLHLSASVGLVAALGFAGAAHAQASDGSGVQAPVPAPASEPASANQADDIIVTAQHRSENIQTVPISIQAFSGDTLQKLGVKSTTDIGNVTTNVTIALPQGAGSQPAITIRGIGLNDNNSNNAGPNGVYMDEFYLSAPTSQTFAMFDLERVEVLKGPQGTLYGRNTSGGAINFVTNKPTDEFNGYLDASYGNFGTYQIQGAVGGKLADGIDGRFAFVRNYSDGYFHNTFLNQTQNGANDYSLRGELLLKPTDDLKILLTVHGSHVDRLPDTYAHIGNLVPGTEATAAPVVCSVAATFANQCVDQFGQSPDPRKYHVGSNRTEHLKVTDIGGTARIDYALGSVDVTSITGYDFNKRFLPEDSDASPYRQLEINWGNKSHEFTQELRLSQTTANLNWVAGLYYLHEKLVQSQDLQLLLDFDKFFGPGAGDGVAFEQFVNNTQTTDAYAAFGQAEYAVTDTLKLIAGGRFTGERRSFAFDSSSRLQDGGMDNFGPLSPIADDTRHLRNSAFSWRAGLNYTPRPGLMFYGTVSTGFKSGDFNGGFLSTDPAQAAVQQQPVKPEKVTTYEVGIKSTFFDRKVTFNAALFYNDYRNLQLFALVTSPLGPLNVIANADKARTYGADVELTVRPVPNLTLSAQLGLLDTKLVKFLLQADPSVPDYSGNQLAFSPHTTAFLLGQYHVPLAPERSLDFQLSATYKSHQFLDSTNDPFLFQNAYWTEDARVAFDIRNFEIAGYVRNLSNKYYFSTSFDLTGPFGFIEPVVAMPRSYGVEAKVSF